MMEVTIKVKAMDDKRPKLHTRFSEISGTDPMDEALKEVEELRKYVSDIDKIRIDIDFHADCGCMPNNPPRKEPNSV